MTADARAYLGQALAYLAPQPPVLVAIGGYSGTGKTTIARAVAHRIGARPGAIHIRSDVARKTLLHRDPLDRLGPDGYTPTITARTYDTIRRQAAQILGQGQSVILDAVHGDPDARKAAETVATAAGCRFVGIWLDTPTRTRVARVTSRGPDASDADADVVNKQDRSDPGPIDWHRIETDQPIDSVISAVAATLNSMTDENEPARGG
jgi:predicted kinase